MKVEFKIKINEQEVVERAIRKYLAKRYTKLRYKSFSKKFRSLIFLKSDRRCHFCGKELDMDTFTLDHKTPLRRGGKPDEMENIVVCCKDCNNDKGLLTLDEYIKVLNSRI